MKRHFLNDIILLAITVASVVSCPDFFLHAEGKNSLVNGLFHFCSKFHVGGTPIRLLHVKDVTNYARLFIPPLVKNIVWAQDYRPCKNVISLPLDSLITCYILTIH